MPVKAVIDRFEGSDAVLFIEEQQLVVQRSLLPPGVEEGDWLRVEVTDGMLTQAEPDPEETAARRARIMEKLDALRRGDQLQR